MSNPTSNERTNLCKVTAAAVSLSMLLSPIDKKSVVLGTLSEDLMNFRTSLDLWEDLGHLITIMTICLAGIRYLVPLENEEKMGEILFRLEKAYLAAKEECEKEGKEDFNEKD